VVTLPLWIALTVLAQLSAPGAGFAVAWPLIVAGVGLLVVPAHARAFRLVSLAALVVGALLSLSSVVRLLLFANPTFGRLPIVMPAYVYPALLLVVAIVLVPPLLAAVPASAAPRLTSARTGLVLALLVAACSLATWASSGYSATRPHLRAARYVNVTPATGQAGVESWEVGGNERTPHADLLDGAPAKGEWQPAGDAPPAERALGRLRRAFVDRAERPASLPFPGVVSATAGPSAVGTTRLTVRVVPESPTATVILALPPGIEPARSNYPGRVVGGAWRAAYTAPRGGVEFNLDLPQPAERLAGTRVAIVDRGLPGGSGWQGLPAWLPQERDAWTARSLFVTGLEYRQR